MDSNGVAKSVALIANALLFQLAWLVNVMDLALLAQLTTAAVVVAHIAMTRYFYGTSAAGREGLWLLLVGFVGLLVEYGFAHFGILLHEPRAEALFGVPFWLALLWVAFATTFRFSLAFLRDHLWWAAGLGALAALSYWGGAALNATSQLAASAGMALLSIGVVWLLVLPILVMIHRRYIA